MNSSLKKQNFMKNKRIFSLILAFLCPVFILGQNVSIVGKTNVPNALVRLIAYDDMLTRCKTQLADTQSDKDGNFVLSATVDEITPVDIAVGLERVDLIICPNGKYNIRISVAEREPDVSYYEAEPPTLYIDSIDDGGFYAQYSEVDDIVNGFIYFNIDKIMREKNLSLLDEIDNQLNKRFGEIKFKYTNDFVKYCKAEVVSVVSRQKVLNEYFDNQEVLYNHSMYMMVFNDVFKTDIKDADFLSRNPQLAELVNLKKIYEKFDNKTYDKQTTLKALEDVKKSSKYQKNKDVATSYAKLVNDLTYDSDAPRFSLKDRDGRTVQLSDYQNSMVLIQFVDRFSPLSNHEFAELDKLQKRWNDTIQVVTIATKESFSEYVQMFENQGYKWQLLNLDDDITLLEKYHVVMFPSYIILKKKGRVGMAPAPSPDHKLDAQVRRISRYM